LISASVTGVVVELNCVTLTLYHLVTFLGCLTLLDAALSRLCRRRSLRSSRALTTLSLRRTAAPIGSRTSSNRPSSMSSMTLVGRISSGTCELLPFLVCHADLRDQPSLWIVDRDSVFLPSGNVNQTEPGPGADSLGRSLQSTRPGPVAEAERTETKLRVHLRIPLPQPGYSVSSSRSCSRA